MLSPGHLMCTWLRGDSQVGAFAAACEPEGKRAHWAWAIPEGLWVERWDSYHGAAYHCFQAPSMYTARALVPCESHQEDDQSQRP